MLELNDTFILISGFITCPFVAFSLLPSPGFRTSGLFKFHQLALEERNAHTPTRRNIDAFEIDVPFFSLNIKPQYDWNYTSTVQSGLNNRTIPILRGFILGGCSSVSEYTAAMVESNILTLAILPFN